MRCPRCQNDWAPGPPGFEGDCGCGKPYPIPGDDPKPDLFDRLGKILDENNMQVTFTGWRHEPEATEKKLKAVLEALKNAQVDFERIAALRSQLPAPARSTHGAEKCIAKNSQAMAMAAATEISRILSIYGVSVHEPNNQQNL